ncbi:GDSL-type esterase/lipase family protein [Tractidigestivibacter scatoligenes]|uniref:GDSL-type esterase/lipase family protein n=1 Tax=Tractidigestivibacter scatoligenes TaxID=1299998 RepID=UPI000A664FFF|nr:GDSL-type esterase/lipase family protein [Tractidigestivibacter scatoligenes]
MKRLGIVAIAAVLVASLAGCRQFPTNDETSSDAVGGDAQAESDLDWRYYPGTSDDDTREIVCWGDSMTQGVGADTDEGALVSLADRELYDTSYQSYPQVLSQLTGLDTYNFGVAGATSAEIAAMQGGLTWEELEAAEQSVEVADADDANAADDAGANDADDDADADDADDQPVSHIDPDVIEEGEQHTGDILVLEIGSNGGWNNDYQVLIDQYRAMIERSGCEDYLILGDTDDPGTSVGDTSQVPFTEDYAPRETNWEAALREAFGDHFINMRVFLIKHGLEISGLTPTEEDVADARLGCISKQLRSDWTHLNARGYFAKAVAVYQRGVKLGYWSPGEGSIDVAKPQRHQANGASAD